MDLCDRKPTAKRFFCKVDSSGEDWNRTDELKILVACRGWLIIRCAETLVVLGDLTFLALRSRLHWPQGQ